MYELVQAGEQSYYINCPAKVGVYAASDTDVWLIDSGSDKEAGRKVRQILDKHGWKLRAILNTHSNADHIGGNAYLRAQTGCQIFAWGAECDFTRHPVLEPSFLWGGYPCGDMRHKFLLAQPSPAREPAEGDIPQEIEIIPLPGHFFDMVGFRTPDDTVFLADCISSRATLEKYGIPFIYDVEAYLKTLGAVEAMKAKMFVPAHADASADVSELVRFNREKILDTADAILEFCAEPRTFESVLREMFTRYGLTMTIEQYALVGSTVRSFLSWLKDTGKLSYSFEDNMMLWRRA